jgi:hypothetical protein
MKPRPDNPQTRRAVRVVLLALVAYVGAVSVSLAAATLLVSGGIPAAVLVAVE